MKRSAGRTEADVPDPAAFLDELDLPKVEFKLKRAPGSDASGGGGGLKFKR